LWVLFAVGPGTANSLKRSIPVPFVGWFISGLFGLYLLTVEMRVLGLLYHTNHHKLRWF
jgi:hypothetical protein